MDTSTLKKSVLRQASVPVKVNHSTASKGVLRVRQAANITDEDVKELAEMEDRNYHTELLVYIAEKILKDKKLTAATKGLVALHTLFGHMPPNLNAVRHDVGELLKKRFSKEELERMKVL